jgi:hypothetical protein
MPCTGPYWVSWFQKEQQGSSNAPLPTASVSATSSPAAGSVSTIKGRSNAIPVAKSIVASGSA